MCMTRRRILYTFLASALSVLYWGCHGPVQHVDLGGSEVVGKTVTKAGTAVADAKVIALQQIDSSYIKADSTTSDAKGQFTFTDLDTGTYKLFGMAVNGDTLVGLISDIKNDRIAPKGEPPARVDAGDLVLLPKGWISGTVIIDKADMSGVLCYTRDSAFMAVSREDGSYTIPRVAEGTYTVCFFYPGYLPKRVDGISVVSGSGTTVPPVYLDLDPDNIPNPPRNLTASYDTVHGVVMLRWNRVRVSDLRDYIVFRKNATTVGEPPPFDTVIAADTVFMDTVFRSFTDTVEKSLVYQVKAVDIANNQSLFSDPLTVRAVPPSTVRPVVRSISADTAVEYGGTARCRITFINAFNNYQVYLMPGTGSPWVPVSHSAEGVADTSFSTGTSSSWGKVRFRIKFSTDSLDTSFTVHVKPRPVAIVSADSTDSTIILAWNRSPDSDFKEYSVHRKAAMDTVIFRSTRLADTICSYPTLSMVRAGYWVAVADTEGETSTYDSALVKHLRIINTPPQFTTMPATLPDSVQVQTMYNATLAAMDRNNDTLSFTLVSPGGATLNNTIFTWTPGIDRIGAQCCTVTVSDAYGGLDTLAWAVRVVGHRTWAQADSLIEARRQFGIAEINGVIYAVGGSNWKVNALNPQKVQLNTLKSVEAYDTATKTWVSKAPLLNCRNAPFIGSWNGKLYVLGGFYQNYITAIEEYDPGTNTWKNIGQAPVARSNGAACIIGDKLYCLGGGTYDSIKNSNIAVKTINIFDLSTGEWTPGPPMHCARIDHQAVLSNGKIYLFGGTGGTSDSLDLSATQILRTVEVFDPALNRCDSIALLPTPCSNFASAGIGASVYLLGGLKTLIDESDFLHSNIDNFSVTSKATVSVGTMPDPIPRDLQSIAVGGRIYCIGGITGAMTSTATTRNVRVYYP
jgi:N-acetylneuraminic acid mutarotase